MIGLQAVKEVSTDIENQEWKKICQNVQSKQKILDNNFREIRLPDSSILQIYVTYYLSFFTEAIELEWSF